MGRAEPGGTGFFSWIKYLGASGEGPGSLAQQRLLHLETVAEGMRSCLSSSTMAGMLDMALWTMMLLPGAGRVGRN